MSGRKQAGQQLHSLEQLSAVHQAQTAAWWSCAYIHSQEGSLGMRPALQSFPLPPPLPRAQPQKSPAQGED